MYIYTVNKIGHYGKTMRYSADEALDAVMEDNFDELDYLNEPVTGDSDDEIGFEDWEDNDIDREIEKEDDNENDEKMDTEDILLPTEWTTELLPLDIQPFTSAHGPTVTIPDSPLEIFQLFFTNELLEMIAEESNRYADQVLEKRKFNVISIEDIKAYFGFAILMGIVVLPSREDYWKKDSRLRYSPIADRISRDRYRELARYLHFVNNDTIQPRGSPNYDKLGKVRPVIKFLSDRFSAVYEPGRDLAVDEAMIKLQGRSSLKQYMPMKPVKLGIKVWVLADSSNSYFHKCILGKVEKGLGTRVVKELASDVKSKHHHIYFDNLFLHLSIYWMTY